MPIIGGESQEKDPSFKYKSIMQHRAAVAALKAHLSPADVTSKEVLIPLNQKTELPVRIYRPKLDEKKLLPTYFYIPGTGFVAWETAYTDMICSHIAEKANCQVIAIYHRLAPESKYPSAIKDIYRILKAIIRAPNSMFNVDPNNIALGGYSSGANIAILVAIQAIQAKLPIRYHSFVSPLVDLSRSLREKEKFKELKTFEDKDIAITEEFTNWVIDLYLPKGVNRKHPAISPFWQSDEHIATLPPTDLFFGEFDRTRIDTVAFAQKLKSNSVSMNSFMFDKQDHSFIWNKLEVTLTIAERLKLVFGTEPIPKPLINKYRAIHIKKKSEFNESLTLKAKL